MATGRAPQEDREPQPSDGPDYHAEHAAWRERQAKKKAPQAHEMLLSANGDGWEVGCMCGWDSPEFFADEDGGIDAWEHHCDAVFMEATLAQEAPW